MVGLLLAGLAWKDEYFCSPLKQRTLEWATRPRVRRLSWQGLTSKRSNI